MSASTPEAWRSLSAARAASAPLGQSASQARSSGRLGAMTAVVAAAIFLQVRG